MTYTDLEALRSKKTAAKRKDAAPTALSNKRYLIITYTVEFDRYVLAFLIRCDFRLVFYSQVAYGASFDIIYLNHQKAETVFSN